MTQQKNKKSHKDTRSTPSLQVMGSKTDPKDPNSNTDDDLLNGLDECFQELNLNSSLPTREKDYKNRLLLGEADFSFAKAFSALRQGTPGALNKIVATEYLDE